MVLGTRHGFFLGMLLVIVLPWRSFAQNINWQQIDENQAQFGFVGYQGARKNVAIDGAGNIITCAPFGNKVHVDTQTFTANFETVIVKRSPAGNVIWSRTLKGTGFKYGHSIHADSLGSIYLLGWHYGNSSIDGTSIPTYGNYDCFLVKISSGGQTLYVKTFGSAGYDYPFALDTDANGNVWVAGKYTFSMQLGSSTLSGTANSHFLFKLTPSDSLVFLKNVCQNGGTDWGIGDLSRSSQGKIAVVANFIGTSSFQNKTLAGGGGYLAMLNSATGDLDTVLHAGSQAWLIDHEPGGNMIVLGLQGSNTDSIASAKLPVLSAGNQLFLARVLSNAQTDKVIAIPKQNGSFLQSESIRSLHVNKAGQIFLSGELESEVWISANVLLSLKMPHQSGRPQAVLAKLDESFTCSWFAGVGSRDTLGSANKNIGAGVFSDPEGNIVWCTMNDAYSVVSTHLKLNNDTFDSGLLSSRYAAHGVHVWKFSEPSVKTLMPIYTTYCPGDSIHMPYQKFGQFSANNRFRLELSDATGAFLNPVLLKEVMDTTSGVVHARIPLQTLASGFYRIRINASSPAVYGSVIENPIAIRGKPSADAGPDRYFCLGDTVLILASGGGTYFWSGAGGILQNDSALLVVLPDSHRLYRLRVVDSVSSCFNDDSVMLRYREKLELKPINDTLACVGDSLVFYARILFGDSSRIIYTWTDSIGNTLSQSDSLVWQAQTGNRIRLVVWDSCSVLPDTQEFRITLRPELKVKSTLDTLVCSNLSVKLFATGSGGFETNHHFEWYDSSFQHVLGEGGQFDSLFTENSTIGVKLSDGCTELSDSVFVRVQVAAKPGITYLDSLMVCALDTTTLRVNAVGAYPGELLYSWDGMAFTTADSFTSLFVNSTGVLVIMKDVCGLSDTGITRVQVRSPLLLKVRQDTVFCLGEQTQLYVQGSEADTGHYSFFWDGNLLSKNYFWETPSLTHTYRVRIRNNCDATDRLDSVTLVVRDSLHLSLTIDTPYCYGEQVELTPLLSGGNQAAHLLTWKEMDGTPISNFPSFTTTVRGNKNIWLVLDDGCTEPLDSMFIHLNTLPVLTISNPGDTLLCNGAWFYFVPTLSGGRNADYSYTSTPWDSASLQNGVKILSPVSIGIVASDGCSESDTMLFEIRLRDALVTQLPVDTVLCEGDSIRLAPVISGGISSNYSFFWQGIASVDSERSFTISADTTLIFRVDDGCSEPAADSMNLGVLNLPDAVFTLSDNPVCVPESIWAKGSLAYQDAFWHWRSEALLLDTISSNGELTLWIAKKGNYLIELEITDSNGCVSDPVMDILEAFPSPDAWFSFSDSVVDRGEGTEILIIKDQSAGSTWWPGYIDSVSPGRFFFLPNDTGYYFVRHELTNQWGCTHTYGAVLRVKEPFHCYVPSAFHPSGYPENRIFLPYCEPWTEYRLQVYSRWGQLVFESDETMTGWDGSYMGKGEMLPGGVYVYILRVSNVYHELLQSTGTVTLIK